MKTANPTTSVGIERLRTLYSVLAGIPRKRINLNAFVQSKTNEYPWTSSEALHSCGTIACAGGWAAIYPEFVEAGLHLKDGLPRYRGAFGFSALANFFEMDNNDARSVFNSYVGGSVFTAGLTDEDGYLLPGIPHRRLALHRIRIYLLRKRAITPQRSRELAKLEEKA